MTVRLAPFAVLLAALAVTAILGGCQGDDSPREATVEDLQLHRDNGEQVLRGTVVNTAERAIRGARLFIDLYDGPTEAGTEPVDALSFEVTDIGPGERKEFRQVLDTGLQLTGARLSRIVLF
jgi:hypothetical protein